MTKTPQADADDTIPTRVPRASPSDTAVVVERVVDAPRERAFLMWTEPARLARWFAPEGATLSHCAVDLRVGGLFHYCMRFAHGNAIWGRGVYREIVPSERLSFVDGFSDETGALVPPSRYGMSPEHPTESIVTVTFESLGAQTRVTLRHELPLGFKEREGTQQGWTEMLARLGETLDATREVVSRRVLPHPRERVFDAFADPAQLARWWGPAGFTNAFHEFDLRPGGRWRFDMVAPEGARIPQEKTFVEVQRPARVVLRHAQKGHDFELTMTFDEAPGGTRLTWRMRFASPEELAAVERHVVEGNEQNFDRLAAHLAAASPRKSDTMQTPATTPQDTGFTIERTFKASPEKVWRMWTTPQGIESWWGPGARDMGFEFTVREMDVRVGGRFAFGMKSKEHDLVNHGTYVVVAPHVCLAWTWRFDIFLGPGEQPYDVPIAVTLTRLPAGGTKMTFVQGPLAKPGFTEGSRQGVLSNFEKMALALGE